jgi:hypothetical protein
MNLFHATTVNFEQFELLNTGNDTFGTGIYFTHELSVALGHGHILYTVPASQLRIVHQDYFVKNCSSLYTNLIREAKNDWWTNWAETQPEAERMLRNQLTDKIGENLQTLWYELYRYNPVKFCKIVSRLYDACEFKANGKHEFVVYNIDKLNSLVCNQWATKTIYPERIN